MKTVLVYENRKSGPIVFDVSTPELRSKAFLDMFHYMQDWDCYDDIVDNYMSRALTSRSVSTSWRTRVNAHAAEQLVSPSKGLGLRVRALERSEGARVRGGWR